MLLLVNVLLHTRHKLHSQTVESECPANYTALYAANCLCLLLHYNKADIIAPLGTVALSLPHMPMVSLCLGHSRCRDTSDVPTGPDQHTEADTHPVTAHLVNTATELEQNQLSLASVLR